MSKNSASRISARFIKSVSLLAVAASIAGCAQGTARFSDGFYTGAVPKQNVGPVQTPFPSNAPQQTYNQPVYQQPQAPAPNYAQRGYQPQQPVYTPTAPAPNYGNVDRTYTGSVPPSPTIQRQPLAAPQVQRPAPAPVAQVAPPAPVAPAPKPAQSVAAAPTAAIEGWTATGGTYVTMRQGETVYNLAKRYGVPANAILEANGLRNANAIAAGTRVIIPTYVYSRTAGVSAPDASAAVRAARSSIGGRSEFPIGLAPIPQKRPLGTQVASMAPAAVAAAVPPATSSAIKTGKYIVTSGDTLSGIARRTGTSIAALKRLNGMTGDNLRIGQSVLIPGVDGNPTATRVVNTAVDRTTTSTKPTVAGYQPPKATKPSGSISSIDQTSTASAPAATGVETMRWPVKGRVISSFGSNVGGKGNDGIDISVPRGTPIKSAENGVVIYSGDGLKEFGKTVLVRHGNGLVTVYGHLDSIAVSRGDNIKRGQQLGVSGMTGSAKQPQLHFEVRKNTSPVNPMTYLR